MTPAEQERAKQHEQQQALLTNLRDSGQPAQAERLQALYHTREVGGLANDVYAAARHAGQANAPAPPAGWHRGSQDPQALRAAGLELSDAEIKELLQPKNSGFRAEIYLPDQKILGPDAKPVLVFKGSTGEIVDPRESKGHRESGAEDFLNNGRQGVGLQSDYYDRAMRAAVAMKRSFGTDFEIAGHSLGGGMASAASAVTGVPATTFNAAGLHPITPARYAEANGLPVYDTQKTVTAYQVRGEMLNDVQDGISGMNARYRAQMGMLANEVAETLRTPAMREQVTKAMQESLPANTQDAARELIDRLATQPGHQALRDMPLAAGRQETTLEPMTRNAQGQLVERPQTMTLSQVGELAGPLADVMTSAAVGAKVGRYAGEQVQTLGKVYDLSMDITGDAAKRAIQYRGQAIGATTEGSGKLLSYSVRLTGEGLATGEEAFGKVKATGAYINGAVQERTYSTAASALKWVGFEGLAHKAEQKAEQAHLQGNAQGDAAMAEARKNAAHIRQGAQHLGAEVEAVTGKLAKQTRADHDRAGASANAAIDQAGHQVRKVTDKAPTVMGGAGAVVGTATGVAATHAPVSYQNLQNLHNSAKVIGSLKSAAGEAVERHSMSASMLPSLDSVIQRQEQEARKALQAPLLQAPAGQSPTTPSASPRADAGIPLNHPAHPDYRLFQGAQAGVHGLYASYNLTPDLHCEQLTGALTANAKAVGMHEINHVVLSDDRNRAFAIDTPDIGSVHARHAFVDVVAGMAQPMEVSTRQVAEINQRQDLQQLQPELAQQQQAPSQKGPQMG